MLCKCYWIVLYTVHVTAFSLGGRFFQTRCRIEFACFSFHGDACSVDVRERQQVPGS